MRITFSSFFRAASTSTTSPFRSFPSFSEAISNSARIVPFATAWYLVPTAISSCCSSCCSFCWPGCDCDSASGTPGRSVSAVFSNSCFFRSIASAILLATSKLETNITVVPDLVLRLRPFFVASQDSSVWYRCWLSGLPDLSKTCRLIPPACTFTCLPFSLQSNIFVELTKFSACISSTDLMSLSVLSCTVSSTRSRASLPFLLFTLHQP